MKTFTIVFVALLTTALAVPGTLPAKPEPKILEPKIPEPKIPEPKIPEKVGKCTAAFTEAVITPVGKCFCSALFNDVISVNRQQLVEGDCVALFGSKKAILAFKDPCYGFMTEDRCINTLLVQTLVNVVYKKCFPKFLFKAHITKH